MSTTARTLSQMSLSQKLGQMFVVCLHGFSLEPETVRMLEEFHFGSVYLYNLNYINPRYMGSFCGDLHAVIRGNTGVYPLLSGTYEGGEVLRFGLYNTSIPCASAIGSLKDPSAAYAAGKLLGAQLFDLGLNSTGRRYWISPTRKTPRRSVSGAFPAIPWKLPGSAPR